MNTKIIPLLAVVTAGLLPSARAQLDVGITAEIRLGRALPPPPPEVVIVEPVGPPGPPPWSHRRWFHRTYDYYYYPECDVYYRPSDRMWFFLQGRTWSVGARLPDGIRIDFARSVSLRLDSSRPYTYHDRVVTYYPRNYFAKVKFKNGHDNRRDGPDNHHDRDDRDRDDHGRGRDKDKHH